MSKSRSATCGMLLVALVLAAGRAWAVELADFSVTDEPKRAQLTFAFSAGVQAQIVSNYQHNFVSLDVPELVFPRELAGRDVPPENEDTLVFYRFVRFIEQENGGQIRIYLGKLASPADVQVVPYEDRIEVELIKPLWKLPEAGEAAAAEGGLDGTNGAADIVPPDAEPAGEPSEEPVEEPDAELAGEEAETPPADLEDTAGIDLTATWGDTEFGAEVPPPGSLRDGQAPPAGDADTGIEEEAAAEAPAGEVAPDAVPDEAGAEEGPPETVEEEPAVGEDDEVPANGGVLYGETTYEEMLGPGDASTPAEAAASAEPPAAGGEEAPADGEAEVRPVRDFTSGPSYKQFDLDDVVIAQVQIRGLPFDEALMELVAESGFNVVVAEGVGDEEVNLDFRQKDLSLKSALDLLCIAYDLAYLVEDDAIIVKPKR